MTATPTTTYTPYVRDLTPQVNAAATWSLRTDSPPSVTFRLWSQSRGEWLETSSDFVERTLRDFHQLHDQLPNHDMRVSFTIYLPDAGKIVEADDTEVHSYLVTEVTHGRAA